MRSEYECKHTHGGVDRRVVRLAAAQYGVFSRAQAIERGATTSMISRRLARGRWESLHSGVYRIAGCPKSRPQSLMAACLAWGARAVISHRAAAALWNLPGFEHSAIELMAPRSRRRGAPDVVVHWTLSLSRADVTTMNAIPVTTPARTLLDLAAVAPVDAVEEALDDALRRKLVTLPRLRRQLGASDGRHGIVVLRALLAARDSSKTVPESVFETRLARTLQSAGIDAVRQHKVWHKGRLVAVVDFALPHERIAIEADGYRWHSRRARWERDLARRNALTSLGWRVLHVTWSDLRARPDHIVAAVARALRVTIRS